MLALVTLALAATACTKTAHGKNAAPPVLGQQSGTPAVVGQPAPARTGQLDAVSCASANSCWAVGTPGTGTTGTGTTATGPSTSPVASSQTVVDATVDGGLRWLAQPLRLTPAPALTGISCPEVRLCMAVGLSGSTAAGIVVTTHDGGSNWGAVAIPTGATVITSVQCSSAVDCSVIATDGTTFWSAHSVDFGQTWQRGGSLPAGVQDAASLSCRADGPCLVTAFTATTAGHGQGAIAISMDHGATWTAANVPAKTGLLQSVDCATVTSCIAAGTTSTTVSAIVPAKGEMLISQDGGHTWTRSPRAPSIDDVYGIDCPSPRICAMVGTKWVGTPSVGTGGVAQSRDSGTSFVASRTEYTPLPLTALACPTRRACIGVGGDTLARIVLGTPKAPGSVTPTTPVGGVHRPGLGGRD